MEKTAMTELRDELILYKKDGHEMVPVNMIIAFCTARIPIERQQIEDAFVKGAESRNEEYQTEQISESLKKFYNNKYGEK